MNLDYYFRYLCHASPRVIAGVMLQRGSSYLKKLPAKRLSTLSDGAFIKNLSGLDSIEEAIQAIRLRREPFFFIEPVGRQKITSVLETTFPSIRRRIVSDADELCDHIFDLLGSGKRNIDTPSGKIDWHRDFKSGEKWDPDIFYTDTRIVKKANGTDIKVPWELSRFQHLPTLGKAYWLTGDEKYATEFVDEINDWIDGNAPQHGVNWTCTMDIAIRAVNWIWGFYFFKDSPEITDEFMLKLLKSFLIHGKHIMGNLERLWRGINSNHYLSDIVGLVYLGVMFPEFKEAEGWRNFGIKELVKEMEKQVHPDGVDLENSISYHRLVTELFLSTTLLCLRNGITFPQWYMQRLEKMIEFVMYYTKPDGTAPQIGDNDDGRLHILSNFGDWDRLDHRHLLPVGAVLFNRPDFKEAAGGFYEEVFWLQGEEGLKALELI